MKRSKKCTDEIWRDVKEYLGQLEGFQAFHGLHAFFFNKLP